MTILGKKIVLALGYVFPSSVSITLDNQSISSLSVGTFKEFKFAGKTYKLFVKQIKSSTYDSKVEEQATFEILDGEERVTVK